MLGKVKRMYLVLVKTKNAGYFVTCILTSIVRARKSVGTFMVERQPAC